jgi:hypothetical protein
VLELGKRGTHGTERGAVPVLSGEAVVATLHASNWKEAATAQVAGRSWEFAKRAGELTGRWAEDPEHAVRLRARKASIWRGDWAVDLEGVQLQLSTASMWKGTHRYSAADRQVAESGTTGGWSPRPTLTATADLPLEHLVFLLWLELVLSRRNDAAAAAI